MLRNFSEKLGGKSLNYTWLLRGKYFQFDDAFLGILELEASPVEGQPLQQKYRKRRKRTSEKKKNKSLKT